MEGHDLDGIDLDDGLLEYEATFSETSHMRPAPLVEGSALCDECPLCESECGDGKKASHLPPDWPGYEC